MTQDGRTLTIQASELDFSGDVTLYTTRFCGHPLGIPLCFTPHSPPPLVLPLMAFTSVVSDQPYTTAQALQINGLQITAS